MCAFATTTIVAHFGGWPRTQTLFNIIITSAKVLATHHFTIFRLGHWLCTFLMAEILAMHIRRFQIGMGKPIRGDPNPCARGRADVVGIQLR